MINLGLSRISRLLSLSTTHQTWKAIHIAGTNGKGSVAALLSSLLRRLSTPLDSSSNSNRSTNNERARNEIRIGRFTSPHLIDRWDCISINDKPIAESIFLQVESNVKSLADTVNAELASHRSDSGEVDLGVTEFELLTATAFEIFSREKCQLAVVECGLGGRLDATNALKDDEVALSIITSVSLDHVGVLGDTVEAIAEQKAGIAKKGVHMLVDRENLDSVVTAITKTANEKDVASVEFSKRLDLRSWGFSREQCETRSGPVILRLPTNDQSNKIGVQVLMPHQIDNITTAISSLNLLISKQDTIRTDVRLSMPESPSATLASVLDDVAQSYQGRLQHLSIESLFPDYTSDILLDGAHNVQSAEALKAYVDTLISLSSPSSTLTSPNHSISSSVTPSIQLTQSVNTDQEIKVSNKEIKNVTWILALSQGKNPVPILRALVDNNNKRVEISEHNKNNHKETTIKVIFTRFSPVDGMPWISPQNPQELKRVMAQYLSINPVHITTTDTQHDSPNKKDNKATPNADSDSNSSSASTSIPTSTSDPIPVYTTNDIIEALELATTTSISTSSLSAATSTSASTLTNKNKSGNETELIVIAGSLYLTSDLLRALRKGKKSTPS